MMYYKEESFELHLGKMQDVLATFQEESIDSIVCDPPYELNFMNKGWDNTGVAYQKETWEHCYRVLKSGGYLLAFGGSRTFHRIACAIEDAGFEIRDTIMWLYGSGFPKSQNIGLSIDKKNGIVKGQEERESKNEWKGWGTALKPAFEPIIVARKRFKGSLVDNVLKYGTGGLNIDECRVGDETISIHNAPKGTFAGGDWDRGSDTESYRDSVGRFPANIIHDGSEEAISGMPITHPTKAHGGDGESLDTRNNGWGFKRMPSTLEDDGGSASRYFYCAKASKKDRDDGLIEFEKKQVTDGHIRSNSETAGKYGANSALRKNIHPTTKPVELMQYLVRLVSPKGAKILDCFMGSGSTGKAVMFENRERNANYYFVGIEMTKEYLPIAKARIEYGKYKYEYDVMQEQHNDMEELGYSQTSIFDF